jgi:hypothetical protein
MRKSGVLLAVLAMVLVGVTQSGCNNVSGQAVDEYGVPLPWFFPIVVSCQFDNGWGVYQGWILNQGHFSINMLMIVPDQGTCEFIDVLTYECYDNCSFPVTIDQTVYEAGVVGYRLIE